MLYIRYKWQNSIHCVYLRQIHTYTYIFINKLNRISAYCISQTTKCYNHNNDVYITVLHDLMLLYNDETVLW